MQVAIAIGLVLLSASASVNMPGKNVHADIAAGTSIDLHATCEDLAERCWDLDPADFGMTPLEGAGLPGDLLPGTMEWQEGEGLALKLAGRHVRVGVDSEGSAGTGHGHDSVPDQVPCGDAPLCPDLLVDAASMNEGLVWDTRTFAADHCAVIEGATVEGERRLLRFPYTTPNLGAGDLHVGAPADRPQWFEWGSCHEHWHFREYADYRLWDVTGYAAWQAVRASHPGVASADLLEAYPEVAEHHVAGHKQGFCVIDVVLYSSSLVAPKQFVDCTEDQGISRSWADQYHAFLDGQWIDVTGLAPGAYVLEAEVNPERLFAESDYENNSASVVIQIA